MQKMSSVNRSPARMLHTLRWIAVVSFCSTIFQSAVVHAAPKCWDDDEAFYSFKNELPNRDTGNYDLRGVQGFPAAERGVDQEE